MDAGIANGSQPAVANALGDGPAPFDMTLPTTPVGSSQIIFEPAQAARS
jgi:hypothetical protein